MTDRETQVFMVMQAPKERVQHLRPTIIWFTYTQHSKAAAIRNYFRYCDKAVKSTDPDRRLYTQPEAQMIKGGDSLYI